MEIRGVTGKPEVSQVQSGGAIKPDQSQVVSSLSDDGDQVEISSAGSYLGQYSAMPAIRSDKVAQARESIAAGTMDTDAKLSIAIDRLLDDLLGK